MSIEIDVKCECGESLNTSVSSDFSGDLTIEVEKCSKCIDEAEEQVASNKDSDIIELENRIESLERDLAEAEDRIEVMSR